MDSIDYCNKLSAAIDNNFRGENDGDDSIVYVSERLGDGEIALAWHTYLDDYVEEDYVRRVAEYIFLSFPEVQIITTPFGDFKKES